MNKHHILIISVLFCISMAMNTYLIYNRYFGLINENDFVNQISEFSHKFNQTTDELVLLSFRKNNMVMMKANSTKTQDMLADMKHDFSTQLKEYKERLTIVRNRSEALDFKSEEWERQEKQIEDKIDFLHAVEEYAGLMRLCGTEDHGNDLRQCFRKALEREKLRQELTLSEKDQDDEGQTDHKKFILENHGDQDLIIENIEIFLNLNAIEEISCSAKVLGPDERCELTVPYDCGFSDRLTLYYQGERIVKRWC